MRAPLFNFGLNVEGVLTHMTKLKYSFSVNKG